MSHLQLFLHQSLRLLNQAGDVGKAEMLYSNSTPTKMLLAGGSLTYDNKED